MAALDNGYPEKQRLRGEVPTTGTAIYTVETGQAATLLETMSFNVSGTTRTVDLAIVAAGEEWEDGTYDVASAISVAAGTPVTPDVFPILLQPGDRVYLLASGAGVLYTGYVGSERRTNQNRAGQ